MIEAAAKVIGTGVAVAAPTGAILATGAVTNLAGGAAIMKTLAVAGAVAGGGAGIGIAVVGVASAGVGYITYRFIKNRFK